jgi:hypothetical protein
MKKVLFILFVLSFIGCKKDGLPTATENMARAPILKTHVEFRTRSGGVIPKDARGYFRAKLDQTQVYENFAIFIEGSTVSDPRYRPNGGIPAVSSFWSTDAFWVIGGTVQIGINTYSPWGNWIYSGGRLKPLPTGTITTSLNYFKGTRVPLVSRDRVMLDTIRTFTDVYAPREYTPGPGMLSAKKYVGPVLSGFVGDTVVFVGETHWDLGNLSYENPEMGIRRDTIRVIFGK